MRFVSSFLIAVTLPATALWSATSAFDAWTESFAQEWVRTDPLLATRTQYLPASEQDALDRKLTVPEIDPAARERRREQLKAGIKTLEGFSLAELSQVQRTSADLLAWKFKSLLRTDEFADQSYVFQQFSGLQVELVNFLSQRHPIRNARDVENYLIRLEQVSRVLDQGVAEARSRAEHGVVPPKFILRATVEGLDRFVAAAPESNVLVASLVERAGKLKDVSPEQLLTFRDAATKIVAESVLPAFGRVRSLLAEQLQSATDDAGMWKLPRGADAYAAALANYTTTDLTPDQIHELGLKLVAELEGRMSLLLNELGFKGGSIPERYDRLNRSLQPPAQPDPRPALLETYTRLVREAELRAEALFDLRPKAPIEIRREPRFTEQSASNHYTAPAPDGTSPGIYWAPLPGPEFNIPYMRSVSYHEAVPGHHFQITLQQEVPEMPRFRRLRVIGGVTAFAEGWGLYAERLAYESGWYEGDRVGEIGYLWAMLFRARRLVADTGIHVRHWTREQAIEYGIKPSEVERYVVIPGQACAYMIGQMKIVELREKAKAALGPKFSLKQFHNVVLKTGEVPLNVLAEVVDEWIASQKT